MGLALSLILAYIIGSIPYGLILSAVAGHGDIRDIGSGNIGATNVLRTGNKWLAFFTLLLDVSKGALAIFMVSALPFSTPALLVGLAAIIGHCFPVWLKFKGGKGVATSLGVLLAAVPWAGFVAICTWGIVAGLFRISSLAALSAVAIAPLATLLIYGTMPAAITLSIAVLVFLRHEDNIHRLIAGTEPKIFEKKDDEPASETK